MIRKERTEKFTLRTLLPYGIRNAEDGAGGTGGVVTPVIKSQEQVSKEIEAAFSGKPLPVENKKIETPTPTKTIETPNPDFKPSGYWDKVKTSYEKDAGEGTFKIPEGLTADNEHEKFIEFLQNNLEPSTDKLHPFAKDVLEASKDPNFDPDNFVQSKVKQKTYLDLPSKDFMKQHLKAIAERDKTGWTDEDIETHINNKDKIQLDAEANSLKSQYKESESRQSEVQNKERASKLDEEYKKIETKRANDISSLIERNKSVDEYFGVKFSEAEKTEFHKWLPDMLSVDKKTGSYPLMDYLRSDDNLMKIAAIVFKTEKGMKDYLSEVKEGKVSDLMKKLKLTPDTDGGGIIQKRKPKPISIE